MAQEDREAEHTDHHHAPTVHDWELADQPETAVTGQDAVLDCGWGRLIFGHTFSDNRKLADTIRAETPGQRDIALYLHDPHVVLSMAPQELFLDPSHTYRLHFADYKRSHRRPQGFSVRKLRTRSDAEAINNIYISRHMVRAGEDFIWEHRKDRALTYLVAEDKQNGEILGTVTGVDHAQVFDDPEKGTSMWCLAVDPQAPHPGVGRALVHHLIEYLISRGRAFMDLSVMYDNKQAIALYEQLGFRRVPVFCVKHKNPINERLFMGPPPEAELNPYAAIIINEARRRGIAVEVLDEAAGYFSLTFGGRTIVCRESLTELTNAIAMSRCQDKQVTHRVLSNADLAVPAQVAAIHGEDNRAFLQRHGSVVVKPADAEQGVGISVDVRTPEGLEKAVKAARQVCQQVILEQYVVGEDLRIMVIDFQVAAAAVRRPPQVVGNGRYTIYELIDKQSRRRQAATGGESHIPIDDETERAVTEAGFTLESVLPSDEVVTVRKTANLHTGGTIHDVTEELHTELVDAAEVAARAINIPVVGLDFIVPSVHGPDYVIIEANERPGLANHEPQPLVERFIDLLFPQTEAVTYDHPETWARR